MIRMIGSDRTALSIKAAGFLLAILPSVAINVGLVNLPPSLTGVATILSASLGALTVVAPILLVERIAKARTSLVALLVIGATLAGASAAVGYQSFANQHVVAVQEGGASTRYVLPLRPSAEAIQIANNYGGDYVTALQVSPRRERLRQLIEAENGGSAAIMTALLLAAQALISLGALTGTLKLSGDPTTDPNG